MIFIKLDTTLFIFFSYFIFVRNEKKKEIDIITNTINSKKITVSLVKFNIYIKFFYFQTTLEKVGLLHILHKYN